MSGAEIKYHRGKLWSSGEYAITEVLKKCPNLEKFHYPVLNLPTDVPLLKKHLAVWSFKNLHPRTAWQLAPVSWKWAFGLGSTSLILMSSLFLWKYQPLVRIRKCLSILFSRDIAQTLSEQSKPSKQFTF